MRYLKGTLEFSLIYGGKKNEGHTLVGYVDSNFTRELDRIRSQTMYLFTLGGCTVSWKATLQNIVASSTTEAEYIAAAGAFKEAIWLRGMVTKLRAKQGSVAAYLGSPSVIYLSTNRTYHEKTKSIDVKLQFVRLRSIKGSFEVVEDTHKGKPN